MLYSELRHKRVLNPLRDNHFYKSTSRPFQATYVPLEDGVRYVYPGMVLAESGGKFVPYSASASYGVGSDVPVGVLVDFYDMTLTDYPVDAVVHGTLVENYCYVFGSPQLGNIPAAVKTALKQISWV